MRGGAKAIGRRAGTTAKSIASMTRQAGAQAIEHGKSAYNFLDGKGTVVKGNAGGGDLVIPRRVPNEVIQPVDDEHPLVHRPCVIEKKTKGKTLYVYGTLLDPRTNPRYLQKHGYTEVE